MTGHGSLAEALLEASGLALVVVSSSAEVLFDTGAAKSLLSAPSPVVLNSGLLTGATPLVHTRVMLHISTACGSIRHSAFAVKAGAVTERLLVRVAPIPLSASRMGAMLAFGVVNPRPRCGKVLEQLFSLSKAEAEVVTLLAAGMAVKEIAKARGVSDMTVKSQLRGAYVKTGVSKQTELLQLVAAVPPLAG
jgi:DNA-binding CsgD family transcriptional regulator